MCNFRTGLGYDVHAFAPERKLILGGVQIPFEKGLLGHSDADVLVHAIIDALLGATALGDIGTNFPDTSDEFKDISSLILLEKTGAKLHELGYKIGNIDSTVVLQNPRIVSYIPQMVSNIALALNTSKENVSVKATTTEGLGFSGKGEGAQAFATVLIYK